MQKIAFLFSKASFWGFALFSSFILLFSVLSYLEYYFNWAIPFVELTKRNANNYAVISIPFTGGIVEFLMSFTIIIMWFTFIYYSLYFYVLQSFFEIFIAEKTFKNKSVEKLTNFYKLNYVPVIVGIIGIILRYSMYNDLNFDEPHFFVLIHLIIAFFLYFYLDLIKKGNSIQQENDLTI
jgi:hypothetical protein